MSFLKRHCVLLLAVFALLAISRFEVHTGPLSIWQGNIGYWRGIGWGADNTYLYDIHEPMLGNAPCVYWSGPHFIVRIPILLPLCGIVGWIAVLELRRQQKRSIARTAREGTDWAEGPEAFPVPATASGIWKRG
jgi:hypothetical protein